MRRRRMLRLAGIGAGFVFVAAVGVAAFLSLQSPPDTGPTQPASGPCNPQPCSNVRGFTIWVSDLKVESGLVSMQLTYENSSTSTHVDPADLELVDANRQTTSAVHDAQRCGAWPRTDFSGGKRFGPVAECFRPAATAPPLSLRWSPDFGFFCCQRDIPLTAAGAAS